MSLSTGARLGPYEILSPLGAGGMGEVYRAQDTRLQRTVAIKVLPAHLHDNPDLKQRLEREARAISALQHPNICTLFDVGSQDGTDFLVMECLEGETLAERLRKGPLPLPELLSVGMQVAAALDKAHRAGIVHRDLKPSNIMLTKSGAKLMDFGLAKAAALGAAAGSASAPLLSAAMTASGPSPISPLTTAGSIVGTIQYMSPEQIEGKEADARSDIFAFGAVLYEMATGQRAFAGKSQISVASAILEKESEPISKIRPLMPKELDWIVSACLAKDPEQRFQSARDVGLELQRVGGAEPPLAPAGGMALTAKLGWAIAALALLAALFTGRSWWNAAHRPQAVIRGSILLPEKTSLATLGPTAGPPALSPDGTKVVYTEQTADGRRILVVRPVSAFAEQALAGTDNATFPFWSPDSRTIGFFADGKLKKIAASGGPVETLADAPAGRGGTWNEDGVIVYSPNTLSALMRVSAAGGPPTQLTALGQGQHSHRFPSFLPDGKHFLFAGAGPLPISLGSPAGIRVGSLAGDLPKDGKLLMSNETGAVYAAPGYLLYVHENTLMARPFDPSRLEFRGDAVPIAQNVATNPGFWEGFFSVSRTNELVYLGNSIYGGNQFEWFDRAGKLIGPVGTASEEGAPRLSPDGEKLAYFSISGVPPDIWTYDLKRNVATRLTFNPAPDLTPIWSPDGKNIYFSSNRINGEFTIFRKSASGMGSTEQVLNDPAADCRAADISRDGKYLLYIRSAPTGGGSGVWVLPLSGGGKPFPLLQSQFNQVYPRISPDGRWVAYSSDETGRSEVFVTPFPGAKAKWQISNGGGRQPLWGKNGKELLYWNRNELMAVSVSTTANTFQAATPVPLFAVQNLASVFTGIYDASPDDKRFLVVTNQQSQSLQSISLVVNWSQGLKK